MSKKRGQTKKDKSEEKIDMKITRYVISIILFIILWIIICLPVMKYSIDTVGARPSGLIALAGITALIISYFIVKRVNKSKLWKDIFSISKSNLQRNYNSLIGLATLSAVVLSYCLILFLLLFYIKTRFPEWIESSRMYKPFEIESDNIIQNLLNMKFGDVVTFIISWIFILLVPLGILGFPILAISYIQELDGNEEL